tara:strand:- start:2111 stop:2341 length:231 start_codon:yes stop_codon:yes gene_type:complete
MNNCAICVYRRADTDAAKQIISICRRYPPTWMLLPVPGTLPGSMNITKQSGWPIVQPNDSCGEFEMIGVPVDEPLG